MPTKLYHAPETPVIFAPSGGDVLFTPTSVANGAGRISTQWDRGSGSKPGLYRWRIKTEAAAALAVGAQLRAYLVQAFSASAGDVPGNFGVTDAAVSSEDKLRNLGAPIGIVNADSTTNGEDQIASGICFIYSRYVSVVWWNALGQALGATAGNHAMTFEAIPLESQ